MHYFTVVLVPGETPQEKMEQVVTDALAPFDENLEVEPYKEQVSAWDIEHMAEFYKLAPDDYQGMAAHMEDWCNSPGGVDDVHGLYKLSTSNPKRHWDWYEIGGRWYGEVRNMNLDPKEIDRRCRTDFPAEIRLQENSLRIKDLDHELRPFAILTPDGEWHEKQTFDWFAYEKLEEEKRHELYAAWSEKEQARWEHEIIDLFRKWQDTIMVGVDIHM